MRPITLIDTLVALYRLGRTVCIEGPPGGGKTTIVAEVADTVGVPLIEQHMPTMLVEDFGIPYPDADGVGFSYKLPDWYPYKGKPGTEDGGILLFDDRNQANADLQKVLANICQARTLHGVPLADGWQVVSTGNRKQDRAGSNRVLSHLRNRETVIEMETHLDDWSKWALDHGVDPVVVAFIRYRPNLLHDFDPQQDQNPTPRSWVEGVSALLGHIPHEAEYECFKGAVGEGAAAEFLGFLKVYRKLDSFRGGGPWQGWLLRIAHREGLNWIRRNRRHLAQVELTPADYPACEATQETDHLRQERRRELLGQLERLHPRQQVAVTLRYLEHRPIREIAAALECGENVARNILFRGLQTMRRRMAPHPGD